jgi:uncharacterized delta-60 repeat protein
MRRLAGGLTVLVCGLGAGAALAASAGDLDTSFSEDGVVDVPAGQAIVFGARVVALPDGRTLVSDATRLLVLRADGTPDAGFGSGGTAAIPAGLDDLAGLTVPAVDGQGRILLAGASTTGATNAHAVSRLLPDGTPDTTWGPGGTRTYDLDGTAADRAFAVAVDTAGRYVVAGQAPDPGPGTDDEPSVLRLLPDGTPDPDFSGDGVSILSLAGSDSESAVDVTLLGDEPVVTGSLGTGTTAFVARWTATGTPKPGFGTDGRALTMPAAGTTANGVAVLPDGRVRIAGFTGPSTETLKGAIWGMTADGGPDPALGAEGRRDVVSGGPGTGTLLFDVELQGDRLLVAGGDQAAATPAPSARFLVGRLLTDGTPDASFSADGLAPVPNGPRSLALASGVDATPQGRPVAVGIAQDTTTPAAYFARAARFVGADDPVVQPPAGTPPPSGTGPTGGPSPTPPAPQPVVRPKATDVLRLPATRRCLSRRVVRLTVKAPPGRRITKVTAKVGSAKARTVRPPVTLSLKGRPKGKVKVTVTATLSGGTLLRRAVTYTVCAKLRR